MARALSHRFAFLLALVTGLAAPTCAWDKAEHRLLADSVFEAVMRDCVLEIDSAGVDRAIPDHPLPITRTAWGGESFGERTAFHAADDFASARFHERGKTIPEQLAQTSSDPFSPILRPRNVIAAFFIEHRQALQLAAQPTDADTDADEILMWALERESKAQGFLADAFSAGHILSYREGILTSFARRNRREAHDYHRDRGVYVVNGRGEIWRTFGDGLLHWYPSTYRPVFEAGAASLREILVTWYVSHDLMLPAALDRWLSAEVPGRPAQEIIARWLSDASGAEQYRNRWLPSLLHFPMPVAAAWSFRTDSLDEHGVRIRRNYPQLLEDGLHDPDARDLDRNFLYARSSVPEWMIPEPLRNTAAGGPDRLIRTDPNWASVRYTQKLTAPPSFKGLLVMAGGQLTIHEGQSRWSGSFGLGCGLFDDLLLLKNVGIAAAFQPSFHASNRRLLTLTAGPGVDLPGNGWPKAVHLEGGAAIGLGEEFDDFGPCFAVGLDSKVMPLGFTYAGVTWRLQYQWYALDEPVSGPSLTLIIQ